MCLPGAGCHSHTPAGTKSSILKHPQSILKTLELLQLIQSPDCEYPSLFTFHFQCILRISKTCNDSRCLSSPCNLQNGWEKGEKGNQPCRLSALPCCTEYFNVYLFLDRKTQASQIIGTGGVRMLRLVAIRSRLVVFTTT